MSEDRGYLSLAKICSVTQRSPQAIVAAANSLGLSPALILDGVRYYAQSEVNMICNYFRHETATRQ